MGTYSTSVTIKRQRPGMSDDWFYKECINVMTQILKEYIVLEVLQKSFDKCQTHRHKTKKQKNEPTQPTPTTSTKNEILTFKIHIYIQRDNTRKNNPISKCTLQYVLKQTRRCPL